MQILLFSCVYFSKYYFTTYKHWPHIKIQIINAILWINIKKLTKNIQQNRDDKHILRIIQVVTSPSFND